ncbi:ubiquinol-cytochrome C chaperone [Sphingomonas oleivorans]|uniref:Ubiquinol-cytochrome C chaperone n=1 Tax=Sphingomonas oleivorans TaxID=1735121 RepID=A0A2T5G2I9_9SPHN|nr:ubiquinol-cytochrome C chaperone family protein [Sphingomonas oleivorans]PTQ13358.1 ubiquinol-cytochrome C chaperone [Sphingomonas oleivorans]
MWRRLFGGQDPKHDLIPLYDAIVREGRQPVWYRDGGVADTLDGRFDMIAAVLSLLLIRLEQAGEEGRAPSAHLTELFVDDMDGQLRQAGIGDIVVGKHIGRMMSALGGRLTAYRAGLAEGGDLEGALLRNLYRGVQPANAALAAGAARLRAFHAALVATPTATILKGELPRP